MLELDHLLEEFSAATLARAHLIRREGKVLAFHVEDTFVFGKVRGSNHETYLQEIELARDEDGVAIEGECSCPVGYNCKHVAALLVEAFERRASGRRSSHARPSAVPVAPPPLPRELDVWLARARAGAPRSGSSTNHRLLYVLSLHEDANGRRRVMLELHSGRSGKNGGFKDVKPFSGAYNANALPQYAQAELELLKLIRVCSSSGYGFDRAHYELESGELTGQLVERLLATGRVFWGAVGDQALKHGASRPATLAWRVRHDGVQETSLEATPGAAVVLPLSSPLYIDIAKGELGNLQPDRTPEQVEVFLSCPPVAPESLPRFETLFRETLDENLPAPRPLAIEREHLPCRPRLTLYSLDLPNPYGSSTRLTDTAALEFAYGERAVPASEKGSQLRVYENGALHLVERDEDAERRAEKRLLGLGFIPVGHLAYLLPADKRHHFTLLGDEKTLPGRWLNFVTETVPALQQAWQVRFDDSFRYRVVHPEDWYGSVEDGDEGWFGLELGVVVEGKKGSLIPLLVTMLRAYPGTLSAETLQALPDDEVILVPFEGKQLALPVQRVRAILTVLLELYLKNASLDDKLKLPLLDAARLLELEQSLALRWHGGERLLELGRKLLAFKGVGEVAVPTGLQASLRPYQRQGLAWLQFLREYNLNGVLADDMGLGKTLQTLAHLLAEKEAGRAAGPSLVVAPTSVVHNWYLEAKRFAPGLKVLVLHGKERKQHFATLRNYDLVLTTYPLIVRDIDVLKKQPFHLLVLDEAQYVKNPKSSSFKAVAALQAEHRLCLSGTPLENHLGELWSLFHFLMPGFLGTSEAFGQLYRTPIERHGDESRQRQLAGRVRPFILRRAKADVARELPPKSEIVVPIELTGAQRDLYETLRVAMDERVRNEIDKQGLARSQIMILDALLKLRQACCDPRLVKVSGAKNVKTSAKLEWLKDALPSMLEEGRKILIFSQFATLLALLEDTLGKLDIPYAKLTGQTRNRAAQIDTFQNGDAPVFLITLKAGGVGLNLTAADTVIHYDPWWNPAAENQATDRAHRIGQDKTVFVYKLIASGSIEEKILKLQERKAALVQGILEGSLAKATSLTRDDLQDLFAPLELEAA